MAILMAMGHIAEDVDAMRQPATQDRAWAGDAHKVIEVLRGGDLVVLFVNTAHRHRDDRRCRPGLTSLQGHFR